MEKGKTATHLKLIRKSDTYKEYYQQQNCSTEIKYL